MLSMTNYGEKHLLLLLIAKYSLYIMLHWNISQ